MLLTRRQFAATAVAGVSVTFGPAARARGDAQAPSNRSFIGGVQFGLQPFCYHDLPMTRETRGELLRRLVLNGMGLVELHAVWCEPNFAAPGVSAVDARNRLRDWRLGHTAEEFTAIRRQFNDAGVAIGSYYINIGDSHTDAEIDAVFQAAQLLGATTVVGSWGLAVAKRLAPFPGRHGLLIGLHNHDNLSDPDAFASEASIVTGLGFSTAFRAMLDVRHFTAANGDAVGFLQRHHDRVVGVHRGDRRRNNGRSTPFGEGDSPIIELLRMIRDNQWPIVALLEFEHGTLRPAVEEVQLQFDYCKRALA
jgi:sugar phosphate isomerase/epimerase